MNALEHHLHHKDACDNDVGVVDGHLPLPVHAVVRLHTGNTQGGRGVVDVSSGSQPSKQPTCTSQWLPQQRLRWVHT